MDTTRTCIDKHGSLFEVRNYVEEYFNKLVAMYDSFDPKGKFQGIPPPDKETCRQWTRGLISSGVNFLAIREERVIGHVVILPEWSARDAEYLIFVIQGQRNRGVGTKLTERAAERAKELGLERLWLAVGSYNYPAIALYRKCGFCFCRTNRPDTEHIMDLRV